MVGSAFNAFWVLKKGVNEENSQDRKDKTDISGIKSYTTTIPSVATFFVFLFKKHDAATYL